MRSYSKISATLAVCWLFTVTVVSETLTFHRGSITASVEVADETSMQFIFTAPSTEFTVMNTYTLMPPGATHATSSYTVSYPEGNGVIPWVITSSAPVTSPLPGVVDVIYTLIPPTITTPHPTTLVTSTTSTPPLQTSPSPSPTPPPNPAPAHPSTSVHSVSSGVFCGRPGEPCY